MDLNTLIGLAATPGIVLALVDDIKQFCQGIPIGTPVGAGSPWPLVRDGVAVAWTWLLWQSGLLAATFPEVVLALPTVVAIGIAVGVLTGKGVDISRALNSSTRPSPAPGK